MVERLFFSKLVTKDLTAIDSNRRLFEGVLTVEMKDRQGEITVRDELMKVLPIWIARGGPITDTHSNRVVGQGINYQATTVTDSDGTTYPAITIQGEIFKDYELDNEIWESIVSGKYKGLSFGGATKSNRVPILQKDGSVAYSLKDLEQYEVAVCEEPAVPLALITQHNALAKSMAGNTTDRGNGQMCIRCDKFKCYVDKASSVLEEENKDCRGSYERYSDNDNLDLDDIMPVGTTKPKNPEKNTRGMAGGRSKGGDSFADVSGKNTPQDDEQAEALENNRGEPQENGSTYHGTDKARHSKDDAVYARSERLGVDEAPATDKLKDGKAMDDDNKDALEEAGLEEEKKLEYANSESEGPTRPANKVLPLLAAAAQGAMAAGRAVGSAAGSAARSAGSGGGSSGGGSCDGGCESTCKAYGDSDNPGGSKYTATNEAGEKTDKYGKKIPGVMSKKPSQADDDQPKGRLTSPVKVRTGQTVAESRTERGEKVPGMTPQQLAQRQSRMNNTSSGKKIPTHNAPYGIPTTVHTKKALDILNLTFGLKAGFKPLTAESRRDSLQKPGARGPKGMDQTKIQGKLQQESDYINEGMKIYPEGGDAKISQSEAELSKAIALVKASASSSFTGEPGGGNWGREPGKTRDDESKSPQEAIQPKHVNKPYDDEKADALKADPRDNPSFSNTPGGYKNRDNGYGPKGNEEFDKKDPRHYTELGAKLGDMASGVKTPSILSSRSGSCESNKAAGDPQLEANNSEDGINRKIRLDNDKNAEAFVKGGTPVDGNPGTGGGVRSGAAYDNSQNGTGEKDDKREVEDAKYTGGVDTSTGGDVPNKYNKATIIMNTLNFDLKKMFI